MQARANDALIVVGVDGSEGARHALAWAMQEAACHGAIVEAVHAWQAAAPPGELAAAAPGWDVEAHRTAAIEELRAAVDAVREAHPQLEATVTQRVVAGVPAAAVLDRQDDAALLVVGTRGRGGFSALLLGSTSLQVLTHTRRPVAVVPATAPLNLAGDVVVGVDGSPGSARALAWAVAEAARRHATLRVVHGWETPIAVPPVGVVVTPRSQSAYRSSALAVLERMTAEAQQEVGVEVAVDLQVADAPAVPALLEAGERAALVVVGTRGRGGFTGLLLGSVSQQVASHAACATVAVPPG